MLCDTVPQVAAVKEWEDVAAAKLLVEAAELERLQARKSKFTDMQAFLDAEQHATTAKARLREETAEAEAAQAAAQKERDEAVAARARAARERREYEEAKSIAVQERSEAEKAKLKLQRLGGADSRGPLVEGDAVRLTIGYLDREQGLGGVCPGVLQAGDVGEIVLLSSAGDRARVMGGAAGAMSWCALDGDRVALGIKEVIGRV